MYLCMYMCLYVCMCILIPLYMSLCKGCPFEVLCVFQLTMNDFSVHRIIGRGGFGEVYGCRKADTGKMYAASFIQRLPTTKHNFVVSKQESIDFNLPFANAQWISIK